MIKTVMGLAYLLILAVLGFLVLVGGAAMLVRLIRWLGSMSDDDLQRFVAAGLKRNRRRSRPQR